MLTNTILAGKIQTTGCSLESTRVFGELFRDELPVVVIFALLVLKLARILMGQPLCLGVRVPPGCCVAWILPETVLATHIDTAAIGSIGADLGCAGQRKGGGVMAGRGETDSRSVAVLVIQTGVLACAVVAGIHLLRKGEVGK